MSRAQMQVQDLSGHCSHRCIPRNAFGDRIAASILYLLHFRNHHFIFKLWSICKGKQYSGFTDKLIIDCSLATALANTPSKPI